jgi:DNA-binding CsgD family transcriptional regulator
MGVATGHDRRLLELIGDMQGLLELHEFRHELLPALRRAVPCDWASLNDIGPDPETLVIVAEPEPPAEVVPVFARLAHENPLVAYYASTRDGRALRFSDLVTRRQLHALAIYKQVYRRLGVEFQIAFNLPHTPDRILGVALSRGDRDFTDRERELLETARPFLIQAYRNAIRYTSLIERQRSDEDEGPELDRLIGLGLTPRQAEILQAVATGAPEREIADRLSISTRTVEKHLERCYRRLGVNTRRAAAGIAWATIDGNGAATAAYATATRATRPR